MHRPARLHPGQDEMTWMQKSALRRGSHWAGPSTPPPSPLPSLSLSLLSPGRAEHPPLPSPPLSLSFLSPGRTRLSGCKSVSRRGSRWAGLSTARWWSSCCGPSCWKRRWRTSTLPPRGACGLMRALLPRQRGGGCWGTRVLPHIGAAGQPFFTRTLVRPFSNKKLVLHACRFGLEGCEALLPGLLALVESSAGHGVERIEMAMSHRWARWHGAGGRAGHMTRGLGQVLIARAPALLSIRCVQAPAFVPGLLAASVLALQCMPAARTRGGGAAVVAQPPGTQRPVGTCSLGCKTPGSCVIAGDG